MLSIVDLIEAHTISRELAVYLLAAIHQGASFMIGARPGGAGKTTVMGALLNFIPLDRALHPADSLETIHRARAASPPACYICHEISPGPYYAYIWDEALRQFFALPDACHTIVTNLHADTLDQAWAQIVEENSVPGAHFKRMHLLIFLRVDDWVRKRTVSSVWESDGRVDHVCVYEPVSSIDDVLMRSALVNHQSYRRMDALLERLLVSGARTIADIRARFTEMKTN